MVLVLFYLNKAQSSTKFYSLSFLGVKTSLSPDYPRQAFGGVITDTGRSTHSWTFKANYNLDTSSLSSSDNSVGLQCLFTFSY